MCYALFSENSLMVNFDGELFQGSISIARYDGHIP